MKEIITVYNIVLIPFVFVWIAHTLATLFTNVFLIRTLKKKKSAAGVSNPVFTNLYMVFKSTKRWGFWTALTGVLLNLLLWFFGAEAVKTDAVQSLLFYAAVMALSTGSGFLGYVITAFVIKEEKDAPIVLSEMKGFSIEVCLVMILTLCLIAFLVY